MTATHERTNVGNPWLSLPAAPTDKPPVIATRTRRVVQQQGAVETPGGDGLEIKDVRPTQAVWWVGVHGGAGETTLASMTGRAGDHHWPRPIDGSRARVLLVARTHTYGLNRLTVALRQWAAGDVPFIDLEAVVLNADQPGRLPKPLRDLITYATGAAPDVWHVPYLSAWRLGTPADVSQARELRGLVQHLTGENS